jgi:hypothetical protein
MLTKNDFSPTDWTTLRDTQFLVGFATLLAGASGLATVNELDRHLRGIMENQASPIPFIRDLTSRAEIEAAQASLKRLLGGAQTKPTSDNMRQLALDQTRASLSLVGTKASAEETDAYRQMTYRIAKRVANAAREKGVLGFGGTQVSEGERNFLDELRSTLQLERVRSA